MCGVAGSVVQQNFLELPFTFPSFFYILLFVPINLLNKYPNLRSVAVIKYCPKPARQGILLTGYP